MPDLLVDPIDFQKLATDILQSGNGLRFKALGTSMRPFILDGDLVEIEPVKPEELDCGDVILCRLHPYLLVLHRVVAIRDGAYIVQGDALVRPDGIVSSSDIVGRAHRILRDNQPIAINNTGTVLLVRVWLFMAPLRRILLVIFRRLRKMV
ncbi:MAG: S26 family signal peptidase [Anaerolineaceae bacterium]|nr:S26 family signal peptidase [Anaerolineaceae bacterium]